MIIDSFLANGIFCHLLIICLYSDKMMSMLTFRNYFIEKPFNTFVNRADPDQAALVRAA